MITIADQFGIKEALKQLGIEAINEGTSTGESNFANGKIIESYSPADGALIAKVKTSSKEDYEKRVLEMKPFVPSLLKQFELGEDDRELDAECNNGGCPVR